MAEITIPLERYDCLIRREERIKILLNMLNANDYIRIDDVKAILEGCDYEN